MYRFIDHVYTAEPGNITKCFCDPRVVIGESGDHLKCILNYKRNQSVTYQNILYTIFFNNQLCIKLLNNLTVLLKPVHAVRQCIDKGSYLKMTSFRQLVFTRVLVLISSLLPITGMYFSGEAIECVQKPKQTELV